jgi:hypothetical protein
MIVIVEIRCDPRKLQRSIQLLGYDEFAATEVHGYAGGIMVGWKRDNITVDVVSKNFQFMHLRVKYPYGSWWCFTAVYASPNVDRRKSLWYDLTEIANNIKEPWMLAGDFNDISSIEEKRGGVRASERRCKNFREQINACKLIDMGSVGPKFTWRGPLFHGDQRIFERLDRALCNDLWRLEFPNGYVKVLTRLEFSDHHPLLISPVEVPHPKVPKQFRFESAWILNDSYNNLIQQCWQEDENIVVNL